MKITREYWRTSIQFYLEFYMLHELKRVIYARTRNQLSKQDKFYKT